VIAATRSIAACSWVIRGVKARRRAAEATATAATPTRAWSAKSAAAARTRATKTTATRARAAAETTAAWAWSTEAATWPGGLLAGFVDHQGASHELLSVELRECFLRFFGCAELDESEAAGTACFSIHHDLRGNDLEASALKVGAEGGIICGKGQVTNVELLIHNGRDTFQVAGLQSENTNMGTLFRITPAGCTVYLSAAAHNS
jgi:hypothetical protein